MMFCGPALGTESGYMASFWPERRMTTAKRQPARSTLGWDLGGEISDRQVDLESEIDEIPSRFEERCTQNRQTLDGLRKVKEYG